MEKKLHWYKIADHVNEIEFQENQICLVEVKGKKICIARFRDSLFAFSNKCPHASGPMAEGYIDAGGNVVCPIHRYKYDMKNGRNVSGEGYYLKNWPVEIREKGVFVGLDEGGSFWDLFR